MDLLIIGETTIFGVTGSAQIDGWSIIDMTSMTLRDSFSLAEQLDLAGDIIRVTPWKNQHDVTIAFYPVSADMSQIDMPQPMSRVAISARPGYAMPKVFAHDDWRYVGEGEIQMTNTGLMVMHLPLRRWNPLHGKQLYKDGQPYTPLYTPPA